jgi:lipopolysaccharide/colanic/teichoic acid biosynthesis glycosyltransferase
MHTGTGSAITSRDDVRVFRFGRWLRRLKIDELPQLFNILRGEMAIVGPRPEDPRIVREHYTPAQRRTLDVLPGLASPGSLYNYTHGEALLVGDDSEARYLREVLPTKLSLDLQYIRHASLRYDVQIIFRTIAIILATLAGRRTFPPPPEMNRLHNQGA